MAIDATSLKRSLSELERLIQEVKPVYRNFSALAKDVAAVKDSEYEDREKAATSAIHQAFRGDRPLNAAMAISIRTVLARSASSHQLAKYDELVSEVTNKYGLRKSRLGVPRDNRFNDNLRNAKTIVAWLLDRQVVDAILDLKTASVFLEKAGIKAGDAPRSSILMIVPDISCAEALWYSLSAHARSSEVPIDKLDEVAQRRIIRIVVPQTIQLPVSIVAFDLHSVSYRSAFYLTRKDVGPIDLSPINDGSLPQLDRFMTMFLSDTNLYIEAKWEDVHQKLQALQELKFF